MIRLGEDGENIYLVGAPGLDGLKELAVLDRFELCRRVGFKASSPVGLFVFHPVLHEAQQVETQVSIILEELLATGLQILALMPNSDAGSDAVRSVLTRFSSNDALVVETHLPRSEFVSWMASSDVMIGNSSSGIIEAATFGTPVVNIGSRQNLRERNQNIIDVPPLPNQVCAALRDALASGAYPCSNIYGDGQAGKRILELLAGLDLSSLPPFKCNAY